MSPEAAASFYGASTSHTRPLCTLAAAFCANVQSPKSELVRSLSRGGAVTGAAYAQNVLDYVRKNVRVEFRYGLSKGGSAALLDLSGTPFDQAELMVELLRANGATATYQQGSITLSGAQFQAWTGISDAVSACRLLANGAIPASINGTTSSTCAYSGAVSTVTLSHVWVSSGGLLYDPSYKVHTHKPKIDLAAAMGCGSGSASTCGSTVASVTTPPTTHGFDAAAQANYVQNANEAAMDSTLSGFAVALYNHIQTADPGAQIDDIVGGSRIDPLVEVVAGASLPYAAVTTQTWTGDIPDQYRTRLSISFGGNSVALFADETAPFALYVGGSKTTPNFPTSRTSRLVVVGVGPSSLLEGVLSTATQTVTSDHATLTLQIDMPYASAGGVYMDETVTKTVTFGSGFSPTSGSSTLVWPFAIVQAFGVTGARQDRWSPFSTGPNGGMLETPLIYDWLDQAQRALQINDGVSETRTTAHYAVGTLQKIYGQSQVLDVRSGLSVLAQASASNAQTASQHSAALILATLEGSIFEQNLDVSQGGGAISLLYHTNSKGIRLYEATASNIEAVLAQTTNYTSLDGLHEKDLVRTYFPAGSTYTAIVPKNGDPGFFGVSGSGFILVTAPIIAYQSDSSRIAYVTTYRNKGSGVSEPTDPSVLPTYSAGKEKRLFPTVDLDTGGFTVASDSDLTTGEGVFPRSLSLQRTLTERSVPVSFDIGSGILEHQYKISASFLNLGRKGLGEDTAADAAATIAALQVARDLYRAPNFQRMVVGALLGNWTARQFGGNTIEVVRGVQRSQYVRQADGAYRPPVGSSGKILMTGQRTSYVSEYGFLFLYNNIGLTLVGPQGDVVETQWGLCRPHDINPPFFGETPFANCFWATKATFPSGTTLTYEYNYRYDSPMWECDVKILRRVSNSLGRFLRHDAFLAQPVSDSEGFTAEIGRVYDDTGRFVSIRSKEAGSLTSERVVRPAGTRVGSAFELIDGRFRKIRLLGGNEAIYSTIELDGAGRIKSFTDEVGQVTHFYPGKVIGSETWSLGQSLSPDGAVTKQIFHRSRPIQMTDPLGRTTTSVYDTLGRLIRRTQPEGNVEERTYDRRSNLLTTTLKAKPGSGLADLVATTNYVEGPTVVSCVNFLTCNKPASEDGPRTDVVDVTNYSWSATTGDLIQILKPADAAGVRPQLDYGYTSYTTGGTTMSFLTSKTEKIDSANSVTTSFEYDPANRYLLRSSTVDPGGLNLRTCYLRDSIGNLLSVSDPRTAVCPGTVQ